MTRPDVLIFAAGCSSRIRAELDIEHKSLLPVNGEAMIVRSVRQFLAAGIGRIVVVTGAGAREVQGCLSGAFGDSAPIEYVFNPDFATQGTARSFATVADRSWPRGMITVVADLVFDSWLLMHLLEGVRESREVENLVVTSEGYDAEAMKVSLVQNDRVAEFGKEIREAVSCQESIGMTYYTASFVKELFKEVSLFSGGRYPDLRHLLNGCINQGAILRTLCVPCACWSEVDTLADYDRTCRQFRGESLLQAGLVSS